MTHASRDHRALDAAAAEAMARDRRRELAETVQDRQRVAADRDADERYRETLAATGCRFRDVPAPAGALLPSRLRNKDLQSLRAMNKPRVLITKLSVRISSKGREYLSGWLGKASVVGFKAAEPGKFGNPVWDLFACEPEPKPGVATTAAPRVSQRQERITPANAGVDPAFDEELTF
jgi:hypothetical protein